MVGKLIRRSEACAANWYTLTLHWFSGSGTCAAVAIRQRQKAAKKASIHQERGEGGAKVSFGYLRAESQSGSVQILSGDKDNALDYETSHGPGIYLFAKFIYELVRLHRNNRADTSPSPCPCPARITQVQTETGALSQTWSCVLCCSSSWPGIVRYQVRQEISD